MSIDPETGPEIVFTTGDNPAMARRVQRHAKTGRLRRLYSGVYTPNTEVPPDDVVLRHWREIVGHLLPDGVISHRSAFDIRPHEGRLIITRGRTRRKLELPGLIVDVLPGRGPRLEKPASDMPAGALHISSEARRFLENLTRGRGCAGRVLPPDELEAYLAAIQRTGGEQMLRELLEQAGTVALELGLHSELKRLDAMVHRLLGSQSDPKPISVQPFRAGERNPASSFAIETPAGDITREATAPRRGFHYQDYRTALEWFALGDREVLFVEVAEDYVRASTDDLAPAQVKALSGHVSLNDGDARRALASFVELTRLHPHKRVRYKFITTAAPTVERRLAHRPDPEGGIRYWQKVQQGADATPLRRALLAMELDPELGQFIESRTAEQLRDDLVAQFDWLVGAAPLDVLKEELTEKVVVRLKEHGLERQDAKRYVASVLMHVIERALCKNRDERRLDKPGLSDLLSSLATRTIAVTRLEELEVKEAIVEHLPRDVLDRNVQVRVEALKNSRHFLGYDKIAVARELAVDVGHPGRFAGASDDVRAIAMAWAARVLLDEQPDVAADLIDAARKLAPKLEAICLTEAIRIASGDVAVAMARLGSVNSREAMTARYVTQRRSRNGSEGISAALEWFKEAGIAIGEFDEDGQALILHDLMYSELWIEAINRASPISVEGCEQPHLLLNCALVALCEAVPEDRRHEILQMPPLWDQLEFPLSATRDDMAARGRAIQCFQKLREVATNLKLETVSDHAHEYLLWLKLKNSPQDPETIRELEELVAKDEGWERWVPLAISSGIKISIPMVRQKLERRYVRIGTHDFNSARALLATILAMGPEGVAADWRRYKAQLATHFTDDFLMSLEAQACLHGGDISGARAVLGGLGNGPEGNRIRHHLEVLISKWGGEDVLATRHEDFLRTGQTFDLEQLIESLGERKQWTELAKYTRELFNRSKSVESAERHLGALRRSNQWMAIIEFFDEYPEFAQKPGMLSGVYAQVCLFLGKWKHVQDAIRTCRMPEPLVSSLQLQVPLLSLQWQDFNPRIDHALADPHSHTAVSLLQLATVAATLGRAHDSRELTAHAVAAAPDDPQILISSYYQASRGKWDDEQDAGEWLKSAIERSGADGVVQRKSLPDLIEHAKNWRTQSEKAWSSLRSGQIWLAAYAKWTNQQLSQVTVGPAIANRTQPDVRRRSIVPAFSGARPSLPLAVGKRAALDPTALMNLAYLGILDELLGIYSGIAVPYHTGAWLFDEFQHAEFHQPRLIEEAGRLLSYIAQDRIRICPKVVTEDIALASQVGVELADLLHRAQELQAAGEVAFVIRTSPVHLADSLLEKEADLGVFGGVLRSLTCLVDAPDLRGALTTSEMERASAFLSQVDRGWDGDDEILPGAVLLLDDLTVTYLQHLGLLQKLASSTFELVIHRRLRDQARDYDALRESGQQMHDVLAKVRDFLAAGVRSGQVDVLPAPMENWGQADELPSPTTELFANVGKFDSILIDDRFFNRYPTFEQQGATSVSIHSTLDVVDYLHDTGKRSDRQWLSYRTELRRSGYALIPVTTNELATAVATTQVRAYKLSESLDLRSIREAVALMRMRSVLILPFEMAWLETLLGACAGFLSTLFRVPGDDRQAALLAWMLSLTDFTDFGEAFPGEMSSDRLRHLSLGLHVRLIAASMFPDGTEEPSRAVAELFDSLLWQDPLAHEWLVEQSRRILFDLKSQLDQATTTEPEKRNITVLLWRCITVLPPSLRNRLLDDETSLAGLGLTITGKLKLNIPGNPTFNRDQIWEAVSTVVHSGGSVDVEDDNGKSWTISSDGKRGAALDIQGTPRPLAFPDMEYMSAESNVRIANFTANCAAAGVDRVQLADLLADLKHGPLTAADVERVHHSFEQFPLPLQRKLVDEMQHRETTLTSLFPPRLSYYEHLISSWRGEPDVRAFAASAEPWGVDLPFDVCLLVRLLSSGHSATSPHSVIAAASAAEVKQFLVHHAPNLDIWSLTAFLEGMLARGNVIEEFGDELLQLLESFDRAVNQDPQRLQLATTLTKAADIRIRSLTSDTKLPAYWRRLAAIAHGAVIERALLGARVEIDPFLERLEPLVVPYNPASIVDMQQEPRWAPFLMNERQLQQELLGRVIIAWITQIESNPSSKPYREKFVPIMRELVSHRRVISSCVPGPAEGGVQLHELPPDQCRELEKLLDSQDSANALEGLLAAAVVGTTALLPSTVRDRLLASISQGVVGTFVTCNEDQSSNVLAWLGLLAASYRDTALAKAVIKLARELAAAAGSGMPATLCLYVTTIAAAAFADRGEWQGIMIECAGHAAYTCEDKMDAINCLTAIEGFAIADWRLQLPLAAARAALKGLIHKA